MKTPSAGDAIVEAHPSSWTGVCEIYYVNQRLLVSKQHVLSDCQNQISWSISRAVTCAWHQRSSWVTNDHRVCLSVCYLYTEVPRANFALLCWKYVRRKMKQQKKSVGKKMDCLVPSRWTDLRGFYIDECPLCKQTLACTNHSEGGEQFKSPWRMSCIVWEYESPCSPIKPILFPFTASAWRSPSLFFFCLVSAPTTSCVSVP